MPVSFGPMNAVTEPDTHTVTVMSCTQLVKSEFLLNVTGYFIHQDPSSILFVQPTQKVAEDFSKERFAPTREVTPALRDLIPEPRSRDSGVTITHKEYPGGTLDFVGANSPVDLASRPKRIVLADEIDKYPPSAGSEGDPLTLAEKRSSTFWNRKSVRACSPTVKGTSRVGREYELSDQRKCFLTCPHCGHEQHLTWASVQWGKDENETHLPETAAVHCASCGVAWSEPERIAALMAVKDRSDFGWRQTKKFKCCETEHEPSVWSEFGRSLCPVCGTPSPYEGHAGFQVSRIYSTRHAISDMVREFLKSKGDREKMVTFVNTELAELWEDEGESADSEVLKRRRAPFNASVAPDAIMAVTAGCDTQGDRLEYEVVGWGLGEESWGLEYGVIHGDPAKPEVWRELDEVLRRHVTLENGRELRVLAACVDSGGHHSDMVHQFSRDRIGRRIYSTKGDEGAKPIWPTHASQTKRGFKVWIVGADTAKDSVYSRFRISQPGPGYCHFSDDYPDEWFTQATVEKCITKYRAGQPVRQWVKPNGARNEALDCRVLALAALKSLGTRKLRPSPAGASVQPLPVAGEADATPRAETPRPAPQKQQPRPSRRDGGWLGNNRNWLR